MKLDKPVSMLARDYIMRKMSHKMNISPDIIETVIKHSFEFMHENLPYKNSIEVSGFGKFLFNVNKAKKKLEKEYFNKKFIENILANPNLTENQIEYNNNKLTSIMNNISYLENKINDKGTITDDIKGNTECP